MKSLTFAALLLSGCAHTTIYGPDGKPVARFEGDMTGMRFKRHADGSMEWSGDVSHSAATTAQGQAAAGKIGAVGSAAVAVGAAALLK